MQILPSGIAKLDQHGTAYKSDGTRLVCLDIGAVNDTDRVTQIRGKAVILFLLWLALL